MGNTRLTVFARTDVGRVRSNNEDAYLVSDLDLGARLEEPIVDVDVRDRGLLLVVSDGMGGHAAGDVASALVVESLRKSLSDPAAEPLSIQRLIDSAVHRANADVLEAAQAAERRGMGATLTAVLVHDTEAYVAEVGDSRGYLLRAGRLRQITKDQSFVQMLVEAGVLTPDEAKDAPQKNLILQAMGRQADLQVSIGRLHLRQGDRLLLCSDGLSNKVSDTELAVLLGDADVATICDRMVDLANQNGGEDNITVVIALVDGDELPAPIPGEQVTQTLEVLQEFTGPLSTPAVSQAPAPDTAPTLPDFAAPPMEAAPPTAATVAPPTGSTPPWLVAALVFAAVLVGLLTWRYWVA